MKRILFFSLILILISSLLIIGCAPSAPPPPSAPPSPGGPPPPSAPPAPKTITWKYNDQNPETGWGAQNAAIPLMKKITEATNGVLQFETYFGQSLTKGIDAWEGTKSGIADISWGFHGYWGGMTTLMNVQSLPFTAWEASKDASKASWMLYEEFPEIQEQFKENKVIILWSTQPYFLITTKKQVKVLEDLKGLKLRVIGGPPTEMAGILGFSAMNVPMPDTYENMQKGVIDGMGQVWEAFYTFKHYEIVNYITLLPMYTGYFTWSVNWDSWNALTPELQEQVMSVCGLKGSEEYGYNMFDTIEAKAREAWKESGRNITEYKLPADELARWQAAVKPIYEKWISDREAEGFSNARKIFDRCQELAAQ